MIIRNKRIRRHVIRKELLPVIVITLFLMTCIFFMVNNVPTFAAYEEIYSEHSEIPLSSGVTKETYLKFTDVGWININVLRMDANNPYTQMEVLTDEHIINGGTVEGLASQNTDYVGAINGDFFTFQSQSVMGQIVRDGQVVSASEQEDGFATFYENINGYKIDYLKGYDSYVINDETGYNVPVFSKNKNYPGYDRTIYIDNEFNEESIGNNHEHDILEIVITDNVVTDLRMNQPPIAINDNQYVLVSTGKYIEPMRKAFKIGHHVTYNDDSVLSAMNFAISGGDYLVKDGKVHVVDGYQIGGRHPRTAVGFTKDNSEVILVTVDGRDRSYTGVTIKELADIMIDLGAEEALNLDGGGSTTMVYQPFGVTDLEVANKPSDGSQRLVYNALGFIDKAPSHYLAKTEISLADDVIVKNVPNSIHLLGVDTNLNPHLIDQNQVQYEIEGVQGVVENGKFTATTSGKGKIKATYNNIVSEMDIVVEDDIVRLFMQPDSISTNYGTKIKLRPSIKTSSGKIYEISMENIKFELPETLGVVQKDGYFVAGKEQAEGLIKASYEGLVTYIPVTVGGSVRLLNDFETLNAHFSSYPASVNGSYEKVFNGYNSNGSGLLYYDFTTTDATRAAYVTFDEPIIIDEGAKKVGMYVYSGEKSDHWLRGTVEDESGKTYNIDFYNNIDFIGWQFVEAVLPQDVQGQLKINRVYVVEVDKSKKDKGAILIDNLQVFNPKEYSGEIPDDIHKEILLQDFDLPENVQGILQYDQSTLFDIYGYPFDDSHSEIKVLEVSKENDSIRKTDFSQWQSIMEWKNIYTNDKIIVTMTGNDYFYDPLEKKLFLDTLSNLETKGNEVILITDNKDASDWYKYDNIEVYRINQDDKLIVSIVGGKYTVELGR